MLRTVADGEPSNMTAPHVTSVLTTVHAAGFARVWVAGGWGVDALVGRQTRIHSDLDLAIDVTQLPLDHLLQAFGRIGFVVATDWRPARVALVASHARQVDLHPVVFDAQGMGWQAGVEGQGPFYYPEDAFAQGLVDGLVVDCLSVAQQLRFHTGYVPRERDRHDIALLETLSRSPGGTQRS